MKLQFLNRHFVVAAFALLAVNAYAYDFSSGMIYYNVLSEEDRTVEVTSPGKGYYYRGSWSIPSKVINNGITYTVTSIGDKAFRHSNELTSVEFPATLVSIGTEAFYGCTQLKTVVLSGTSLTSVGDGAFSGCSKLISADLSTASLTAISEKMFYECGSLTDVKFSTSLAAIGAYAFYDCDKLTSVDLSSTSLVSVGSRAFENCDALTEVVFPASLTSIEEYAFYFCTQLTGVDLSGTSLASIGNSAFCSCKVMDNVEFPASLTSLGSAAFSGCYKLTSAYLSSTSLVSVGNEAFSYCEHLTNVELPTSLMNVGDNVFEGCKSLSKLTIDENNPAFTSRDDALYTKEMDTLVCYPTGGDTVVVIPGVVHSVREDAFPCEVSAVYCQPQTPPEAVDGEFQEMFSADELMNAVLYVPIGTKAAYMQVDPWRNFWNIEETDLATVGIDGVTAQDELTVTVRGGKIVVEGAPTADVVEVFSIDGRCAYRGKNAVIDGLPGGVYVVRVGKFTQKVAL